MKPEGGFGGASFAPPPPVVTRFVIGVCAGLQIAATVGGAALGDALARHAGLIPARVAALVAGQGTLVAAHGAVVPTLPGDVPAALTLVTSLFLHAGWLHLLVNLSFLLWVGRHVEAVAGHVRFAALYLLGGIAGGLLQVAVEPGSAAPVVGASGAIAAVFGAYAMLFARSRLATRRVLGVRIGGEVLTALWYLAAWIALQLMTALAFNTHGGGIAIWTHVGGFIVGLVAARWFARRLG